MDFCNGMFYVRGATNTYLCAQFHWEPQTLWYDLFWGSKLTAGSANKGRHYRVVLGTLVCSDMVGKEIDWQSWGIEKLDNIFNLLQFYANWVKPGNLVVQEQNGRHMKKCRFSLNQPLGPYPPWILKRTGLEISGQRLISSIGKSKGMFFFLKKFQIKKRDLLRFFSLRI